MNSVTLLPLLTSLCPSATFAVDARRRGELSVICVQSSTLALLLSSATVVGSTASGGAHDATRQSPQPSPESEGTAWIVELEQADHRLGKPHNILKTYDEVDNLVHEPGLTGHKSELMMSPASRVTWRGFSAHVDRERATPRSIMLLSPTPG
jgi:hypothetical protein